MSVVAMGKIMIVSHRGEAGELLEALQQAGICQILNAEAAAVSKELGEEKIEGTRPRDLEQTLDRLEKSVSFLKNFTEPQKGLAAALAPRPVVDRRTYDDVISNESILDIVEQCLQTQNEINKLEAKIENYTNRLEELRPWEQLEVEIEQLGQLRQVKCRTGFIPAQRFENLRTEAEKEGAVIRQISTTGTSIACVIVALNENSEKVGKLLRAAEFAQVNLAGVKGTVADAIKQTNEKLEQTRQELDSRYSKAKSLTGNLLKLQILEDHYSNLVSREQTKGTAPATQQTVIFEGWVKKKDYHRLEKIVRRFPASSLHKIQPGEGEETPVEIENANAVKPFELITRLYGMPQYFNIDPTVFLAPFFTVFFALCLADAGYGILMVAIAGWLILKMQGDKKLLWMLVICGVSTTIFGAMTGGWFGDVVQQFIPGLGLVRQKLMVFDPLKNPIPFLLLSIGLGYFQINVGILIALAHNLKRRDFIAALCDQVTWLVMLNSLLLLGLGKFGLIDAKIGGIFGKVAIVPAVIILVFSEREGGWGGRLGMGFYNVFSTIFYLGDVLSYLRLMALGMVGAGLAMAVNVIAKLALNIPYGLGIIIMIVILVGGHLFNLGMSALGAFVHTLRLQFVEFFPKFIVGGGRSFEPLVKQYKHIYMTGDEKISPANK